jgi:hypothetical protein
VGFDKVQKDYLPAQAGRDFGVVRRKCLEGFPTWHLGADGRHRNQLRRFWQEKFEMRPDWGAKSDARGSTPKTGANPDPKLI